MRSFCSRSPTLKLLYIVGLIFLFTGVGNIEKFGTCWTRYRHQKSLMAPGEYGDIQRTILFPSFHACLVALT